ncbi:hypothetical protein ACFLUE_02300 [Chloroflexota bacterium]
MQEMCTDIELMSNGSLVIDMYAVGELVPWTDALEAVRDNVIQMDWTSTNTWAGKQSAFELLGATPFGMTSDEYAMWIYAGDGMKYIELLYEPWNIKAFPVPDVAFGEIGGHSTAPVNSLADLQGKAFRSGAGVAMEVLTQAGVNAIWTAGEEIYTSLDRGLLDVVKWGDTFSNWPMAFHEVAPYMHGPGWHKPGQNHMIEVNLDPSYNALTDGQKAMIKRTTESWASTYRAQAGGLCAEYLQKYLDYGCTLTKLPDEDVAKLIIIRNSIMSDKADENPLFKEIWENQKAFIGPARKYKEWDSVTGTSYELAAE